MIAALLSLFGATLISDLCCLLYLFEFTKMCFFYPRGVASQAKNHLSAQQDGISWTSMGSTRGAKKPTNELSMCMYVFRTTHQELLIYVF